MVLVYGRMVVISKRLTDRNHQNDEMVPVILNTLGVLKIKNQGLY